MVLTIELRDPAYSRRGIDAEPLDPAVVIRTPCAGADDVSLEVQYKERHNGCRPKEAQAL